MPALVYQLFCKVTLLLFPLRGEVFSTRIESRLDHVTALAKGVLVNMIQPGVCTLVMSSLTDGNPSTTT